MKQEPFLPIRFAPAEIHIEDAVDGLHEAVRETEKAAEREYAAKHTVVERSYDAARNRWQYRLADGCVKRSPADAQLPVGWVWSPYNDEQFAAYKS